MTLLPEKPNFGCSIYISKSHFDEWYDSVFEGAVEVSGCPDAPCPMYTLRNDFIDTHRALMLKPVPIKRGVTKQEILKVLNDSRGMQSKEIVAFMRRIEQEGIVNE